MICKCEEGNIFVLVGAAPSFTPAYIRFSLYVSAFFSAHLTARYMRFILQFGSQASLPVEKKINRESKKGCHKRMNPDASFFSPYCFEF